MISTVIKERGMCSISEQPKKRCFAYRAYGKPSKPRCQEPSMYEILSWKDDEIETQQYHSPEVRQSSNHEYQCQSMKKMVQCKSLPAQQFIRSKNVGNSLEQQNFCQNQLQNSCQQIRGKTKKVNISNVSDLSRNQTENKASQSMKKITTSTKQLESSKQIKVGNTQKNINQNQFRNSNETNGQSLKLPQNQKSNKLQKKTIPYYSDPDKKPRYMQPKKTAVQKLVQSPDFDQQNFQKMKQDEIKRFKETTRDLSNTAFLTYFNKPPFENYGRQNKNAVGVLYGDYMYSHNIFPHTGDNKPQKQQTYVTALSRAKSAGNIRPHPPLSRHLEEKLISSYLTLTEIYPKNTSTQSIPIKNQTVLQNLPNFNITKSDEKNYPRYSPYVNANQNEQLFAVQKQYLSKEQIPRYFSSKDEIEGKQITYTRKIQPPRRNA